MTKQVHVLLIEDDDNQRELVSTILKNDGYLIRAEADVLAALDYLTEHHKMVDIVITDYKLADSTADEIINWISHNTPNIPLILITAYASSEHAIKMMRIGVDEYIPKPFDKATLLFNTRKLLHQKSIKIGKQTEKTLSEARQYLDQYIIGNCQPINQIKQIIEKVAATDTTVLIYGESGTGKELVATAMHQLSARKQEPFIAVNCAAITETLAESEFFGAVKGAYTGAYTNRAGYISEADGGTLFLDEIGELSPSLQGKLLRFLESGVYTPVGANKERTADVRILAATNRNLASEVKAKNFRSDLYFRLNIIPLNLPSLADRGEDVALLSEHFFEQSKAKYGKQNLKLSTTARRIINSNQWPGNARQLSNFMERLVLLSTGSLITDEQLEELDFQIDTEVQPFVIPKHGIDWQQHEKDCLQQALEITRFNRAKAARLLGLNYKAFLYRLDKHNIE